jgi:hypothetical protein
VRVGGLLGGSWLVGGAGLLWRGMRLVLMVRHALFGVCEGASWLFGCVCEEASVTCRTVHLQSTTHQAHCDEPHPLDGRGLTADLCTDICRAHGMHCA